MFRPFSKSVYAAAVRQNTPALRRMALISGTSVMLAMATGTMAASAGTEDGQQSSNGSPYPHTVVDSWIQRPERRKVVFVLGRPGAGKGTNCEQLEKDFGWVHLSAGDLLRAEMTSGSPNGTLINQIIHDGKIVPSEITVALLDQAMQRSGKSKFLIDGFPRNWENNSAWEKAMNEKIDFQFLLLLDCPEEVIISRLTSRGRSDDNVVTMKKRIQTFNSETSAIIDYYTDLKKIQVINSNQDKDKVYEDISAVFRDL